MSAPNDRGKHIRFNRMLIAAIPLTDFSSRKLSQLVSAGYGVERSGLTLPLGANFKSSS